MPFEEDWSAAMPVIPSQDNTKAHSTAPIPRRKEQTMDSKVAWSKLSEAFLLGLERIPGIPKKLEDEHCQCRLWIGDKQKPL